MKVTDAKWELKNLGLRVCELEFAADEVIPAGGVIPGTEAFDYIVAKVPAGNTRAAHRLEEIGYRYLENQLELMIDVDQSGERGDKLRLRFKAYSCRRVSSDKELGIIIKNTADGLFDKDRFSVDPLIDPGLPSKRIANWTETICMDRGSMVYAIYAGEHMAGYFILTAINASHAYVNMAGIFRKYQGRGLSFLLIDNILARAGEEGFTAVKAAVSVNNIRTINTFTRFVNFRIKKVVMIFRRFNSTMARDDK